MDWCQPPAICLLCYSRACPSFPSVHKKCFFPSVIFRKIRHLKTISLQIETGVDIINKTDVWLHCAARKIFSSGYIICKFLTCTVRVKRCSSGGTVMRGNLSNVFSSFLKPWLLTLLTRVLSFARKSVIAAAIALCHCELDASLIDDCVDYK